MSTRLNRPGRQATVVFLVLGTAAALVGARPPTAESTPRTAPLRHAEAPPTAHTGGFGEPTCLECHDEFDANLPGGRLVLVGLPEHFEPGRSYGLTVRLESEGMVDAGFQLSARFASGAASGRPAGTLAPVDGRTAVTPDSMTAVPYAHHTRSGTPTPDPSVASWSLTWTAPPAAAEIVFHMAANSANGDDSPLGDLIYTATATAQAASTR